MDTPTIQNEVQDNLNRSGSTGITSTAITTKIQRWINAAKREIEKVNNLEYMKTVTTITGFQNGTQSIALPVRTKAVIVAKWRVTGPLSPISYETLTWQDFARLSESEIMNIEGFVTGNPDVAVNDYPMGWSTDSANFIIHPNPPNFNGTKPTIAVQMAFWQYSADFTFGGGEEPYLAANAWNYLIAWATKLGFEYLGETQDAQTWEQRAMSYMIAFKGQDVIKQLNPGNLGVILVPDVNAASRRPALGWDQRQGGRQSI